MDGKNHDPTNLVICKLLLFSRWLRVFKCEETGLVAPSDSLRSYPHKNCWGHWHDWHHMLTKAQRKARVQNPGTVGCCQKSRLVCSTNGMLRSSMHFIKEPFCSRTHVRAVVHMRRKNLSKNGVLLVNGGQRLKYNERFCNVYALLWFLPLLTFLSVISRGNNSDSWVCRLWQQGSSE